MPPCLLAVLTVLKVSVLPFWFAAVLKERFCVLGGAPRRILHRDLKSQNVFLTASGTVKLGDFGVSTILNSHKQQCMTAVGTPNYIAPEIFNMQKYKYEADIWSLGILLYKLCCL